MNMYGGIYFTVKEVPEYKKLQEKKAKIMQ